MPSLSNNPIDDYLETLDENKKEIMMELRAFIKKHALDATEKISWSMPTFYLNGNLIHFFAHKSHIGLYPGALGIEHFSDEFKSMGLKFSKGAVQFPLNRPLPWDLIERIVKFCVNENTKD